MAWLAIKNVRNYPPADSTADELRKQLEDALPTDGSSITNVDSAESEDSSDLDDAAQTFQGRE
eukprot:CAMPEP_0197683488 /NCGR_PEP_ID=MMETSP1338-20131121/98029_1 /TAXON_ID=43686 ORGANISM="Pelagodinium beii, Strain RCC1491" /NCGR_SAMPLE_ID=MMETSP1338 /ASSEMBLY_ACC=CAM_ASM_000754 /LENGTH=62 /DNA_ID=CAMNT_0043265081 /DNA_START=41 /DNA_END=229 /DNA_ORIENTATION=+